MFGDYDSEDGGEAGYGRAVKNGLEAEEAKLVDKRRKMEKLQKEINLMEGHLEGHLEPSREAYVVKRMTQQLNIAAVFFEQEMYQDAIKISLDTIDLGRVNRADVKLIAKAFSRIAHSHKKLGELGSAKIFYEKSLSEHRTPETSALLADVEKIIKDQKEYVNPGLAEEETKLGNELFKKGDFAGALRHYTEAISRNPSQPKLYSNRAACYTKLAEFDLGLKDCDTCLKLDPGFGKGHLLRGRILHALRDYEESKSAYELAYANKCPEEGAPTNNPEATPQRKKKTSQSTQ